jgi:ABC-type polysaccharide/polyol phosphate export permease
VGLAQRVGAGASHLPRGGSLTELFRRRELLLTLVERQLRLRSKRSVMGVVWPMAAPLFLLVLYVFVFGSVFDVPIRDYPVYLFAGLLPWSFLVQSVHDALQSISFEPELVRRAPFPYHFLPLARVIVLAIPFLVLLVGFVVWVAVFEDLRVVLLPWLLVPVAALLLLVAGIASVLALVDVFNRDLRFVLNNLLTVWFFLVPIVYSRRMAGGSLDPIRAVDPMNQVIGRFRDVLYTGHVDPAAMFLTLLAGAAVFVASLALFHRAAVDLAKDV